MMILTVVHFSKRTAIFEIVLQDYSVQVLNRSMNRNGTIKDLRALYQNLLLSVCFVNIEFSYGVIRNVVHFLIKYFEDKCAICRGGRARRPTGRSEGVIITRSWPCENRLVTWLTDGYYIPER